jgi:hypothetical protein
MWFGALISDAPAWMSSTFNASKLALDILSGIDTYQTVKDIFEF